MGEFKILPDYLIEILSHFENENDDKRGSKDKDSENKIVGNVGLFFHKFPSFREKRSRSGRSGTIEIFYDFRKLEKISEGNFEGVKDYLKDYYESIEKYYDSFETLTNPGNKLFRQKEKKLLWRLVIGLGEASVYEVSMRFSSSYGIPYIPGTALKGVTRSYVINEYFDGDEKEALKSSWFVDLFGSSEENKESSGKVEKKYFKGKVVFFDAYPCEGFELKEDIINPHYFPYYESQGKKPPADYYDPVPTKFLTVEKASFKIVLGYSTYGLSHLDFVSSDLPPELDGKYEDLLGLAFGLLEEALEYYGVGAKTSVGYGYFKGEEESE